MTVVIAATVDIAIDAEDSIEGVNYSRKVTKNSQHQTYKEFNAAAAMPDANTDGRK